SASVAASTAAAPWHETVRSPSTATSSNRRQAGVPPPPRPRQHHRLHRPGWRPTRLPHGCSPRARCLSWQRLSVAARRGSRSLSLFPDLTILRSESWRCRFHEQRGREETALHPLKRSHISGIAPTEAPAHPRVRTTDKEDRYVCQNINLGRNHRSDRQVGC